MCWMYSYNTTPWATCIHTRILFLWPCIMVSIPRKTTSLFSSVDRGNNLPWMAALQQLKCFASVSRESASALTTCWWFYPRYVSLILNVSASRTFSRRSPVLESGSQWNLREVSKLYLRLLTEPHESDCNWPLNRCPADCSQVISHCRQLSIRERRFSLQGVDERVYLTKNGQSMAGHRENAQIPWAHPYFVERKISPTGLSTLLPRQLMISSISL